MKSGKPLPPESEARSVHREKSRAHSDHGAERRPHKRSSIVSHLLLLISLVSGLLWLGPAIYLLYLNFTNHVVGLSIACPTCTIDPTFRTDVGRESTLIRRDHDILGVFQLVSKALEIWYIFVATSLVYSVCMFVARTWRGLPLGYMLSYVEFSDLRSILVPGFWKVPLPARERYGNRKGLTSRLFVLALFIAIMSIAANIMGPATAVLLIPTLQWKTINSTDIGYYGSPFIQDSPQGSLFDSACTSAELSAGNYSCALDRYGALLDLQVTAGTAAQFAYKEAKILLPNSIQIGAVSTVINASVSAFANWSPNFRVVGDISNSLQSWYLSKNVSNSNFLQTQFIQTGPSYSFAASCTPANTTRVSFSDGRQLQCYQSFNWLAATGPNFNKSLYCFPIGSSWNSKLETASFSIENAVSADDNVAVNVYSTDTELVVSVSDPICKIPDDIGELNENSCPWDRLRSNQNYAFPNQTFTEFSTTTSAASNQSVICRSFAGQGLAQYVLDATAPLYLVSQSVTQEDPEQFLFQHPDWYLAAWSVDRNGTVDGNRKAAQQFTQSVVSLTNSTPTFDEVVIFQLQHLYSIALSRSMINIDTIDLNAKPNNLNATAHPKITIVQQIYVYAYGSDSRTLRMGLAVVIFGCVTVLIRTILVLVDNTPQLSAVGMLITSIKHTRSPEFADPSESETRLAKLRYRLVTDKDGDIEMVHEDGVKGRDGEGSPEKG